LSAGERLSADLSWQRRSVQPGVEGSRLFLYRRFPRRLRSALFGKVGRCHTAPAPTSAAIADHVNAGFTLKA